MKLAMIGTGKLGSALLAGMLSRGVLAPEDMGLLSRDPQKTGRAAERFGAPVIGRGDLATAEYILLCVQPGAFQEVAAWAGGHPAGYISTLAGVTTGALRQRLGSGRVVRAMPSLAATIGRSQTALTATPGAEAAGDLAFARGLFGAVGDTYDIPEALFDTFTGMSASGLAYTAVFAEALADGGVRMGLPRPLANELAQKLLVSSGELLAERPHPALLKDEVCSPGGTTIAGIRALERSGFRASVMDAVEAATRRGHELGRGEPETETGDS
ncbi:pyrroline-5-carboxylate reductase [Deinococcus proteolyticus MRP]|uniref:Pyrroline-5-carboxylate reductase n=1 Tax=Deinococcus proteolyticus (strain ATCC 35074 / DSM 20540 / JCM 6276 / NBRC 101906 / NCIMB 13154 / VKM Ac-1939 / CCM 2703 / MRP) TaxID=693977 RepID=F0RNA4_DEIPM|nr:pyrroline-5-carboxylate reductase [Deinococcus proteolyticus]ADY26246.1 pyrroline-5-carboxylate reductase [Deinococcus proteolyticus MRP]